MCMYTSIHIVQAFLSAKVGKFWKCVYVSVCVSALAHTHTQTTTHISLQSPRFLQKIYAHARTPSEHTTQGIPPDKQSRPCAELPKSNILWQCNCWLPSMPPWHVLRGLPTTLCWGKGSFYMQMAALCVLQHLAHALWLDIKWQRYCLWTFLRQLFSLALCSCIQVFQGNDNATIWIMTRILNVCLYSVCVYARVLHSSLFCVLRACGSDILWNMHVHVLCWWCHSAWSTYLYNSLPD